MKSRRHIAPQRHPRLATGLGGLALLLALAAPSIGQVAEEHEHEAATLNLCAGASCTPATLLETDIDITVTGIIARTRVTQRFHNPSQEWVEGVYVFPLPEGAAVDHLLMYVGDRVIEGQIEERRQARRTYERARDAGIVASLVEQDRPNLFRTSVANIGPGEIVEIDIELQHLVRYDAGEMRLRFPTVVADRYSPDCDTEHDAIDPIVALSSSIPRALGSVNPLTLEVAIDAGFPLRALYSPSHRIEAADHGDLQIVTLRDDTFADRDFVLAWRPDVGDAPISAVFYEQSDGDTFALVMLLPPPLRDPAAARMSREVVYVIDTSGSMGGASIRNAKLALLMALDQLQPGDWFDVVDFDSDARSLFGRSVAASADTVDRAREFVESLDADGGTNIQAALDLALVAEQEVADIRQVVFITDGAVGNEAQIFARVASEIGDTRLFTIGIGAAPNAHFMRKAAHFGRGTYTFIGSPEEISERMAHLFDKLESATLTDIEVDWNDLAVPDVSPRSIPDLYAGEPLLLTARLSFTPERIGIEAVRDGKAWSAVEELPPPGPFETDRGIGRLWARREIETLMDDLALGGDRDQIRDDVIELAFEHHLVTKFTSLVAVDISPSAPAGAAVQHLLPLNQPAGSLPSTATPATLHALIAFVLMLVGSILSPRRRTPPCLDLTLEKS